MREANKKKTKKKTAQPACPELRNNFYLSSDSNVELHNSSVELLSNTVGSTDAHTLFRSLVMLSLCLNRSKLVL